ncbi:FxSxx-COOH system tetratricopeptide repeat protein [Streptomyces cavernicola]|uniref:FxSxx-COOH system tetratricopeptide repeat protein n=1 Tax=Streptomyces cavernicola TaxID=3043613 RepID=A0ABT6S8Y5_9ACTN|nr:FxSxx-COOH system tetratricopeptide repeat protein [Streptomyces sp. B-S-A6]MDI3404566.1 FxSxx-COOH system tetratricopeptide repeat protein [Streptomyces sp. B-S-A6]
MTAPTPPQHLALVHAGQSAHWAAWMSERLARSGAETSSVLWDPLRRRPDAEDLDRITTVPGPIVLVLDDWFLRVDHRRPDVWVDLVRELAPDVRERLVMVTVTASPVPEGLAELGPVIELRGLAPEAAEARLLDALGLAPESGRPVDLARGRFPDTTWRARNTPRRNARFTGREQALAELHGKFTEGGEGARVALHGVHGVGKTATAIEFVHRHAAEYDTVWWVRATKRATAREGFAELADRLDLLVDTGDVLRGRIEAVKRELAERRGWLIVLDGAEDPEELAAVLPDGPGHLLITTTSTTWGGAGAELVELPPFERDESVAFACLRTKRLRKDAAAELADAVEDMPLLLAQTAAWLDTNSTADVDEYVREIREGDPHAAQVATDGDDRTFQMAWSITLNTLRDKHPHAYELLCLLVFFSPDAVPVRLLRTARAADLPDHLAALVAEPSSWNGTLRRLSEATSMRLEYDKGPYLDTQIVSALQMHRLFHRFVRVQLTEQQQTEASGIACQVLVSADPREPGQAGNWARYAELIPHLEEAGALASASPDVRTLVLNCIEYLRVRGEYKEGVRLGRATVDAWTPQSGPTDPQVLVATHQLMVMERRLGNYAAAERLGRKVLAAVTASPEQGPIQVVRAKNGLAGTLMALGLYEEARTLLAEAAAQSAEALGDEGVPRTLATRGNLAIALGLTGRYQESYELHRGVLKSSIELLGGRSQSTLHAGLHTAWMLRLLGRYEEALAIQEQNSNLHSQVLDKNHSQSLLSQHNLALCRRREGDIGFARVMMRSVLDRFSRRRGPSHPETLMVSSDYAMLLRDNGDLDEARELAESTLGRYRLLLGEHHPYTAGLLDNCALIQRCQGDHDGARPRAEEARQRMERALGRRHVWSIGCAMNGASARAATGDLPGAVELGRDALDRARAEIGERHVLSLNLAAGLAQDLRASGAAEEAEQVHREALTVLEENLYDKHRQVRYMFEGRRPYWDFEPQTI